MVLDVVFCYGVGKQSYLRIQEDEEGKMQGN